MPPRIDNRLSLTRRKTLRLKDYDYSQAGAYFVTLCTQNRACRFGEVVGADLQLNRAGQMAHDAWEAMPVRYAGVSTDAFVVMPNHLHGILLLSGSDHPVSGELLDPPNLAVLIRRYKTMTSYRYAEGVRDDGWPAFRDRLWQRGYFEHVIRGPESLLAIRQYIAENPGRWSEDVENPRRVEPGPEGSTGQWR